MLLKLMSNLVKSTLLISVLNALSLGFVFASNIVIASVFGSGTEMDIYLASTTLPFFLITIISGSINLTFIPVFAEYKTNNKNDLWKVVSSIMNLSVIITLFISIVVIFGANSIMSILTPGFSSEEITIGAELLRLQILLIIFSIVNELMSSVYYSNQKFLTPLLNKLISPIITITFVLLFKEVFSIKSIVLASLLGMFIQTLVLSLGFIKNKTFKYIFVFHYKNPGVKKVFRLILPLIAGLMLTRIIPIFDRYIASGFDEGSISYLGYSMKIYSMLPAIISGGISLSIFPLLSIYVVENNISKIKETMSKGIRLLFFVSIPIVFVFLLFGYPIINLLFVRGAFTNYDALQISRLLSVYILALPIAVIGEVIAKGYYIFQDTKTPVILGAIEMIVYFAAAYILLPKFRLLAIPIAFVIYYFSSIINAFIVRKKLGGKGGKKIIVSFYKHTLSGFIVFGIVYMPVFKIDNLLVQNILIFSSIIFYFVFTRFLIKSEESIFFWNTFVKKTIQQFK
jgi:putative peptidoglycan lipid II flippase